jgi:hypothetical protein
VLAGCVVASALTFAFSAHAERKASIALTITDCPIDQVEVRRIVSLELHAQYVEPASTTIQVGCSGAKATLRVVDTLTHKIVERSVDFGGTATIAQNRLFALAIADLVSASWAEIELEPAAESSASVPAVQHEEARLRQEAAATVDLRRPPRARTFDLSAYFAVRGWSGGWVAYGAAVGFDLRTRPSGLAFGGHVGLGVDRGAVTTEVGDVSVDVYDAQAVAALVYGVRAHVVRAGLGVRSGAVRACGSPSKASVSGTCDSAFYAGPLAAFGWTVTFGALALSLRAEAGIAAIPVQVLADGKSSADARAVWIGGGLGVGVAF